MSLLGTPIESIGNWVASKKKTKSIFFLDEGSLADSDIISTKGAHLCEMCKMSVPVPQAFILSTEASLQYYQNGNKINEYFMGTICEAIGRLERATGYTFGADTSLPLILCLRSGALVADYKRSTVSVGFPESWQVPGMMNVLLGIGFNDQVVRNLSNVWNERCVLNNYANFLMMYGNQILDVPIRRYEAVINDLIISSDDVEGEHWSTATLKAIIEEFKKIKLVPSNVWEQLRVALEKLYQRWFDSTDIQYRDMMDTIPKGSGVAVIIQEQVLGGYGVFCTRDCNRGTMKYDKLYGSYWSSIDEHEHRSLDRKISMDTFSVRYPDQYKELVGFSRRLEAIFQDMQAIEFGISFLGRVWLLNGVDGHRHPVAALQIMVDLQQEGLLTERQALLKLDPDCLVRASSDYEISPQSNYQSRKIGKGVATSDEVVCGVIIFSRQDFFRLRKEYYATAMPNIIMVKQNSGIMDVDVIKHCCAAIVLDNESNSTTAVYCRGMNKLFVSDISNMKIEETVSETVLTASSTQLVDVTLRVGDKITVIGRTGEIVYGTIPLVSTLNQLVYSKVLQWANKGRRMKAVAKIRKLDECACIRQYSADGIVVECCNEDIASAWRLLCISQSLDEKQTQRLRLQCLQEKLLTSSYRICFCSPYSDPLDSQSSALSLFIVQLLNYRQFCELLSDAPMDLPHSGLLERTSTSFLMGSVSEEILVLQIRAAVKVFLEVRSSNAALWEENAVGQICLSLPPLPTIEQYVALLNIIRRVFQQDIKSREVGTFSSVFTLGLCLGHPYLCQRHQIKQLLHRIPEISIVIMNTDMLTQHYIGCTALQYETQLSDTILEITNSPVSVVENPFETIDTDYVGPMIQGVVLEAHSTSHCAVAILGDRHTRDAKSISCFNTSKVDVLFSSVPNLPTTLVAAAQAQLKEESPPFSLLHSHSFP